MSLDQNCLSNWLHNHFYALDDPPADKVIVPIERIKECPDGETIKATIIYVYEGQTDHEVRIEFDKNHLDKSNFEFRYIKDY